ncbi:sum2 [Fusarium agapanthi]|uniref:Sum2 n=1 Tax=Fusarium agapanthi TaxID=1803897 RepID=A0A9P5BGE3_9HYPO|nr:sum2 [Fusarium agapanthi]
MSNPLDTDAGSELFSSYEAEFKLIQADLNQKLDQIPELAGEPRKAAISQAERALEELDEQLGAMRLEKQNIPTSSRTKVNQRFRNYESDTDAARRKLTTLSSDRSALFGSRYTDDPAGSSDIHMEQRQQLLSGTDRLDRSTQRLKASQALANETEAIGAGTLADLNRQRETIEHTRGIMLESEGYVDRSVKTLRGMARRSRISLISKSDIRYVGTLHEINSDESTVSLENVRSFGTEGRKGRPGEEIAPSDQVYEYIVFRGSDVKDLRIEDHPNIKENKPPAVPDDPAIVGARARPGAQGPNQNAPPGGPAAFGPGQGPYPPNNFYGGPPPGNWGRGGAPGPGPGPNFGNMPYPPPPGWFPPGQGFPGGAGGPNGPGGPGGPAPWSNYPVPPFPGPNAPVEVAANQRATSGSGPSQDAKPAPIGPGADRAKQATPSGQAAPPTEPKSLAQGVRQPSHAPTPPVESKPSVEEVKQTAASLAANGQAKPEDISKTTPTGPRNHRINPVIPLTGSAAKPFSLPGAGGDAVRKAPAATAPPNVQDATNAARAAVAVAMAQLGNNSGNAMDNLTNKVNEMRVNAVRGGPVNRGRGRGGRPAAAKVAVPDSDFDFAQSNAKFNKQDVVKEAIAGSPLETPENPAVAEQPEISTTTDDVAGAYNKSRSFFDNISSESRERTENGGQKPGGREWRGEEQRKNMETFGQGSVDGAYRNYRGRSRGRGRGGRGYGRGGRGGNRPQYHTPAQQ